MGRGGIGGKRSKEIREYRGKKQRRRAREGGEERMTSFAAKSVLRNQYILNMRSQASRVCLARLPRSS